MNWRAISKNVGFALLVSALFMFLSIIVSIIKGNDSALAALTISFTITFIVGIFPLIFVKSTSPISLKEGYVIITLSWLLSFIFGMLPYALWGGPFSLQNAWFESVSGFTTTGSTILENVEALPDSLLFWRASTHFIGGLGVVVFLLLIIPDSSPARMRLSNMEVSSLSRGTYSTRANKMVYVFAYVYLGIMAVALIAYLIAGMPLIDAICHAMSICATGGFSSRNTSIAAFNSPAIEIISVTLMYLASVNFGLVFLSLTTRSLKPLFNPVVKFYTGAILCISLFLAITLLGSGTEKSLLQALRIGLFQTVSVTSTTGFSISDSSTWSMTPCLILMLSGIMCGCAGSTTGGLKADRVLVLFKAIGRQIHKVLRPSSVNEVRIGNRVIGDEEMMPHILFICLFALTLTVSILISMILGAGGYGALSGSLSSLSNVGLMFRDFSTPATLNAFPHSVKLLLTLDMFLGRVEIYPVLAVVAMIFSKFKK